MLYTTPSLWNDQGQNNLKAEAFTLVYPLFYLAQELGKGYTKRTKRWCSVRCIRDSLGKNARFLNVEVIVSLP